MKIIDYDSAEFENFIQVVIYFGMEEKFKEIFGIKAEEYLLEGDNYSENLMINNILSMVRSEPGVILASAYKEDNGKFEIIKIVYEPTGIDEINKNIDWLKSFK